VNDMTPSRTVVAGMTPQEFLRYCEIVDHLSATDRKTLDEILSDPHALLRRIVTHAKFKASRKRKETWRAISLITSHGSGMSTAIAKIYDRDLDPPKSQTAPPVKRRNAEVSS